MEVYADAFEVRLELNGRTVGTSKLKKYKTSFKCPYEKGTLTAIALDEKGIEISRHSIESAGKETVLSANPEKDVLKADGMSLCYLPIEFTDKNGNLKPYMEEKLEIKVDDPQFLPDLEVLWQKRMNHIQEQNFIVSGTRTCSVQKYRGSRMCSYKHQG